LASLCLKEIDAHVPEGLEVHIVMDNYATHKTPKIKAWLTRRPHYHVHFTPTSASWINQVERWRRTSFFYLATVVTPAMVMRLTNIGSQYLGTFYDAQGSPLDGAKTYKVTLPPNIPAAKFWSFTPGAERMHRGCVAPAIVSQR
jgi:hypothetical protein